MKITDVKVFKTKSSTLIANANITLDNELVIKVKLIEGKSGKFLSFPNHENCGEYYDDVFPITKEFRTELTDAVIDAYEESDEKRSRKRK